MAKAEVKNMAEYIWEVTIEKPAMLGYPTKFIVLADRNIESAMPKAAKLLREIEREDKRSARIVRIEAGGIVDAF